VVRSELVLQDRIGIIVGSEHLRTRPQRLSIDILVNTDALAVTELELDQAADPCRVAEWEWRVGYLRG
jgi:hypothetical protein